MITQCETIEMLTPNKLLISVEATKYENSIKSMVYESNEQYEDKLQSKYVLDGVFDPNSSLNRRGLLYQVIIEGKESDLVELKDRALDLIESIDLFERCFRK